MQLLAKFHNGTEMHYVCPLLGIVTWAWLKLGNQVFTFKINLDCCKCKMYSIKARYISVYCIRNWLELHITAIYLMLQNLAQCQFQLKEDQFLPNNFFISWSNQVYCKRWKQDFQDFQEFKTCSFWNHKI